VLGHNGFVSDEDGGIGVEPNNPNQCSEVADGVARQSEGVARLLGYSFGRCYSPKTGRAYIGTTPSKKRVQRICQAISAATRRSQTQQAAEQLVEVLLVVTLRRLGSSVS